MDELRSIESSGGVLNTRDKKLLEELERDVKAVRKARETLGDKAPSFPSSSAGTRGGGSSNRGRGRGDSSHLGKRCRDGGDEQSGSEADSTTESVRRIPMPRDTPPPISEEVMRQWNEKQRGKAATSANMIPLPEGSLRLPARPGAAEQQEEVQPEELRPQTKTVYEAAPQVRDLQKEAVSKFVPSVVRQKIDARKGVPGGRLLEEEEMQRLEGEGYGGVTKRQEGQGEAEDEATRALRQLEEEERRFEQEMRMQQQQDRQGKTYQVELEEVEDDKA